MLLGLLFGLRRFFGDCFLSLFFDNRQFAAMSDSEKEALQKAAKAVVALKKLVDEV